MASASLAKFSELLRYQLYECNDQQIPLGKELAYLENFIELEKLRQNNDVEVMAEIDERCTEHWGIAPFILMTFVENVFKYGTSNNEPSTITIKLTADENGIYFFCRNKLFPPKNIAGSTGIGIANTTKRLERLYPQKYTLNISTENGQYTVTLSLLS